MYFPELFILGIATVSEMFTTTATGSEIFTINEHSLLDFYSI